MYNLKDHRPFNFRVRLSKTLLLDCSTLKVRALWSFKMLLTIYQMTWH